jgi:EAL domain-containing protein (putative c-di-GMP-specific phosphodiesterase class I)/ActR/RegA family two-component response regulator
MVSALRFALERGEFGLHYQPCVDLNSGEIRSVEALIRWQRPDHGTIPPGLFIPLAEETGLIIPIGEWVLRTACVQAKAWQSMGNSELRIAVNVSARQFRQQNLAELVQTILSETGLEARYLELELTESALLDESEALPEILGQLKHIGVSLSLDDFGTGYSSLSHLQRFPIDIVKIDRSFINDVTTNVDNASIVNAIIAMARSLDVYSIAEGVETEGQAGFLKKNHCDAIQGYYVSRPRSAMDITQILGDGKCISVASLGDQIPARTLLVLDDEQNIIAALNRLLRRDGYRILTANTSSEAFELLATNTVGVILCDLRMPTVTGVEFLRAVKKFYPDTIRIVLSGYAELQTVIDAINDGAIYKFFVKPWDDDQLRANLAEAFSRYEAAVNCRGSAT